MTLTTDTGATRPLSVLVVEDHEDSRRMLVDLLEWKGMRARSCATIGEALALVGEDVPDAVITDLDLQGEHGRDLAIALRSQRATEHVAVIAVTGAIDPTLDVVRHVDAYLRKPLALGALPGLIRALVAAAEGARRR